MSMTRSSPASAASRPWGLAEIFIVSQTAIPALLFLPGTQGIRFYVRVASFALSMALLVWWAFGNAKHSKGHPAQKWLIVSMIYTAAMVFHPFTSSTLAGLAQLVLYVSVIAPLFWAPAVVRSPGSAKARCWSAPRARARPLAPPATGEVASGRRSPTPTPPSATCR